MARKMDYFDVAAVFLHARQLDLVFALPKLNSQTVMFRIPKTVSQIDVSAVMISHIFHVQVRFGKTVY